MGAPIVADIENLNNCSYRESYMSALLVADIEDLS